MEINSLFNEIANKLELGTVIASVERVAGGYMHKMYRLETASGLYAVKLLNPAIMLRPDVFENYKIAEQLELKLQESNIPVIPALIFNGVKMQYINDRYFYIFDWVDGKALSSDEVTQEHCKIIGEILAHQHKIEQINKDFNRKEVNIDWDSYINIATDKCPEIVEILTANRDMLYKYQNDGNLALHNIAKVAVISNGDMDNKNVLWTNGKPSIIDLECLCYGNPQMELFQLALCWSGFWDFRIDYKLMTAFIKSYIRICGDSKVSWQDLYYSNMGKLEWLEYSIKRALMIECEDEEERQLGIQQTKRTIELINYYVSIKDKLLTELHKHLMEDN